MKTFAFNPGKFFKQLFGTGSETSLIGSARWALKRIWNIHAPLSTGIILATLVRSLTPAGLVLMARGVINAVASGLETGQHQSGPLMIWLVMGLVLSILEAVSRISYTYFSQRLYDELNIEITSDLLSHASKLDVGCFEDKRFQDILQRARHTPADHFGQFIDNLLSTITNIVQLGTLAAILVAIEPRLTLLLFVLGLPYLLFQWKFVKVHHARQHSRATKYRWTQYFTSLLTSQRSVPEIKIFNISDLLIRKFQTLVRGFRDQDRTLYRRNLYGGMLFYTLSTTAFYATFGWIAFSALRGALTMGDVAVYGAITMRLSIAIENTILSATRALEHTLFISNLIEFMKLRSTIADQGGGIPEKIHGAIQLNNVSFTYPGAPAPALTNISLDIRSGETIAFVGENGAGKTTLAKLIARLYDPDAGEILLDGTNLQELSLPDFHARVSFVFQEFGRYEASIFENIAYGNWAELSNDRSRLKETTRRAGMHEMIEKLPQGYDTMLGKMFGDYTLSGGQWQQIALARAFTKNAKVLILDEPTSNLDAGTEYKIFCRYRELAKNRTTVLISHRFTTVSIADRIFVMEQGQIIESGSHQTLLAQKGHYESLYRLHQLQMDDVPTEAV